MKAMQDKIIAVITNMVLSLAIIVVASTMSSDVTGNNEGEQNKLDTENEKMADVDASLLEMEDLFVGVAVDTISPKPETEGVIDDVITDVAGKDEIRDVCNADDIQFNLADVIVKSNKK